MDKLESLLDRLEKVTTYLESFASQDMNRPSPRGTSDGPTSTNAVLADYDKLLHGPVNEFSTLSSKIGSDVAEQCKIFIECFEEQRRFLALTLTHSKPSDAELLKMAKPLFESIGRVESFRDQKRSSPQFNHLSAVSEAVAALKWIVMPPSPAPYVKSMQEAAEFYTNPVIKAHKASDQNHVAWAKLLISLMTQLMDYVKQHYPTGLTWNPSGNRTLPGSGSRVPPPPPPRPHKIEANKKGGDTNGFGALFADLNRGEAVTSGLRKVTDDMKTHKNPNLRNAPGLEPRGAKAKSPAVDSEVKPKAAGGQAAKPVCNLEGDNKWIVENYTEGVVEITETKPKHTVYALNCGQCTISIKGKINSIVLDNCKKTGVLFEDLISSLNLVNCQRVKVQCLGQLSTVEVDLSDECQIYLSPNSLKAEVVTSKSSGLNIYVPKEDGDFDEYPVPCQFKSVFTGKGLETTENRGI